MPIAAVAGSAEVMGELEEVFFSGTHGGEALSLAAARAVLDTIADGTVLAAIEARGRTVLDGIAGLIDRHGVAEVVSVGGGPQRTVLAIGGDEPLVTKSWIQQCQAEAGCLFNGGVFVCARHSDADVTTMLEGFDRAFAELAAGTDLSTLLAGPPVEPVFRAP